MANQTPINTIKHHYMRSAHTTKRKSMKFIEQMCRLCCERVSKWEIIQMLDASSDFTV